MKFLKTSFLLIAITILASSVSTAIAGTFANDIIEAQKDTTQNKVIVYEVFGMDCPGCQSGLEKQVKKIEGVADAKASFKAKEVIIELKPGANVTDEEIENRIKKANFTPGKKVEAAKNEE